MLRSIFYHPIRKANHGTHQPLIGSLPRDVDAPNPSKPSRFSSSFILQCPLCECSFDTKDSLDDHMDSHQQDGLILECDFCGKEFTSKLDLTKHTASHAQESQGDPQCQLCGNVFATREEAVMHLRAHSTSGSPGRAVKREYTSEAILRPEAIDACEPMTRSSFVNDDCLVAQYLKYIPGPHDFPMT